MAGNYVDLKEEGVPHLRLYDNGTIINTRNGLQLPFKKSAKNPAVEYYDRSRGKSVFLCIHKLLNKYFNGEIYRIPADQKSNLAFLGCSKYTVTKDGRIWSHIKEDWMIPTHPNNNGYITLQLQMDDKSKLNTKLHRLVALAFLPPKMNCNEIDHINGNKLDNRVENLEWVSTSENLRRAREQGLRPQAVSDEEIHLICRMIKEGLSNNVIARVIGTYTQIIEHIRNGVIHQRISSQYGIQPKTYVRNKPIDHSKYRKHWSKFKTYIPRKYQDNN